jgi:hypothetical protein
MAIDMPTTSAALPPASGGVGGSTASLMEQAKAEQAAASAKRKGLDVNHEAPAGAPWEVPTFPKGFDLSAALDRAYGKATKYINKLVTEQGYAVSFEQRDENTLVGKMIDTQKNQVVKEYDARQMLKLYADGPGGKGFIIDGKI